MKKLLLVSFLFCSCGIEGEYAVSIKRQVMGSNLCKIPSGETFGNETWIVNMNGKELISIDYPRFNSSMKVKSPKDFSPINGFTMIEGKGDKYSTSFVGVLGDDFLVGDFWLGHLAPQGYTECDESFSVAGNKK